MFPYAVATLLPAMSLMDLNSPITPAKVKVDCPKFRFATRTAEDLLSISRSSPVIPKSRAPVPT